MLDLLNVGTAALILALAGFMILAGELFAASVGFITYGLLLTLVWAQLQSIDVALIEGAIGGGLTGALVIGTATRLRGTEGATFLKAFDGWQRAIAAALSSAIAAAVAACVIALPDPAPTLAQQVSTNIAATGVGNPITAVLLAFRAMDTLLEAIVLLFALIAVWSLTRDGYWQGRPGPGFVADPEGVLAYAARILVPVGIVVAIYIFWVGADYPGGKFQGATILAAMWLLATRAGLTDAPPISRAWLRTVLVGGPLLFIGIGFTGTGTAGAFLAYPTGYAKTLILAIEWALLPSLALILFLLLAGAPQRTTIA